MTPLLLLAYGLAPTTHPRLAAVRCCAEAAGAAAAVTRCAVKRDAPAAEVIDALDELEIQPVGLPAVASDLDGQWELIFSSAAAKVPFIDGYMPNREVLTWDLEARRLELAIETLPFVPAIRVVGEKLSWDEQAQMLSYTVGDKPPSTWTILFVDRANGVVAARSSVTGLNVIKRLRGGGAMLRPSGGGAQRTSRRRVAALLASPAALALALLPRTAAHAQLRLPDIMAGVAGPGGVQLFGPSGELGRLAESRAQLVDLEANLASGEYKGDVDDSIIVLKISAIYFKSTPGLMQVCCRRTRTRPPVLYPTHTSPATPHRLSLINAAAGDHRGDG